MIIKYLKNLIITLVIISIYSCSSTPPAVPKVGQQVDQEVVELDKKIRRFTPVTKIDHARFARKEGVYTPPSIVTIFSNPKVNTKLIQKNPLIAIDLPYKVLCYSEADTTLAKVAYTSAEFLKKRHGLTDEDVKDFNKDITRVISAFPQESVVTSTTKDVTKHFGIHTVASKYDFETTVKNLNEAIGAQGDTEFFAVVDYQKDAKKYGVDMNPMQLILFGGPAPGGKAMHTTPRLGLDAFCQKLLVFADDEGNVTVAFNDIVDFSELYYDTWTIPQRVINYRLNDTFSGAVTD
ncbi:DUF302 domain-containing protein [Flammeovirga kamogawensis]|uniref:DUF302 domain-containing protein n=1 Tax=Flammeovirga kamogawensis TaxID=373891 RepID=A0ABX8H4L2_9BACT|nr:DUF302 domain-containing protein [Flammeovirga kamogawensis]MBB6461841.1 uncharacterized protein (DUF302 family) [Flammeovirga kamogawensis]QWG10544.1 DUF302 domain-containing protein [Flammeovirga kamogawensis]TRX63652.1 DUF302 domain-containing protein [Flammeovirga kamogawensis]